MAEFIDIFFNGDDENTPFSVYDEKGNLVENFGMTVRTAAHPDGEPFLRVQARELSDL